MNELWGARANWKSIGVSLGLDYGSLSAIEWEYRQAGDCLIHMIVEWLRMLSTPEKPITWAGLVMALEQGPLKDASGAIVESIRKKYNVSKVITCSFLA